MLELKQGKDCHCTCRKRKICNSRRDQIDVADGPIAIVTHLEGVYWMLRMSRHSWTLLDLFGVSVAQLLSSRLVLTAMLGYPYGLMR